MSKRKWKTRCTEVQSRKAQREEVKYLKTFVVTKTEVTFTVIL